MLLISVAAAVVFAGALVLVLGLFLPLSMVDQRPDEYEGRKQQAVVEAVGEMYERRQDGLGTRRVTTWRIDRVHKCASRCPHPYAVRLDLYTIFGIPYGETGIFCGSKESSTSRSPPRQSAPL